MPKVKRWMNLFIMVSAICIMVMLIVAYGFFTRSRVGAMKSAVSQEQKPAGAVSIRYESNPQLPAAITEAYLQVGEPYETKLNASDKFPARRDLTFTAKIVNQSAYPITQLRLAIENPTFLPNQIITIICQLSGSSERTANKNQPLKPNNLFTFSRKLPLDDKRADQQLVNHILDFRLKVIGVSYSTEDDQLWRENFLSEYDQEGMIVAQSMKDFSDSPRFRCFQALREQTLVSGQDGQPVTRLIAGTAIYGDQTSPPKIRNPIDPDSQVPAGSIQPMSPGLMPRVLYKEKAGYTPEARANRVQGTVVLIVVFGADGTISQIRVLRGLPDGLTEKAMEAARKVRFQPAVKNGVAVSVRGNLEFTFSLDH